ncbi:MAG: hypothetical protein EOO39_09825 [Cytophagaceae bacterium]|nr:MAG: hypothetical protein EOO39_09825 [Cytophagaceae bacterium]
MTLYGVKVEQMVKMTRQKVSAAAAWKKRMERAKAQIPEGVGQLGVIRKVVEISPEMDRLTNLVRWKNAYSQHVADPELTELVEAAVSALTSDSSSEDTPDYK